jgi:predicted GIY-YIG superfamily endonuclease
VDKLYCVYILTNQRNTVLYTGVTGDLASRIVCLVRELATMTAVESETGPVLWLNAA